MHATEGVGERRPETWELFACVYRKSPRPRVLTGHRREGNGMQDTVNKRPPGLSNTSSKKRCYQQKVQKQKQPRQNLVFPTQKEIVSHIVPKKKDGRKTTAASAKSHPPLISPDHHLPRKTQTKQVPSAGAQEFRHHDSPLCRGWGRVRKHHRVGGADHFARSWTVYDERRRTTDGGRVGR